MTNTLRFSLDNLDAVEAELDGIAADLIADTIDHTHAAVDYVKNKAITGINNGPKSGRIYTTGFRTARSGGVFPFGKRDRPHQASAQGEYPAADFGNLTRSMWGEVSEPAATDPDVMAVRVVGEVGADAGYAAPLEYKPPERGGRPFLRRALNDSVAFIKSLFLGTVGGGGAS